MYEELIECVVKTLIDEGKEVGAENVIEIASKALIARTGEQERMTVAKIVSENDAFKARNRERWREGFSKLHALRETALYAGMTFRDQFLEYSEYETDPLLGVLMRQHAHACRISSEIIHLLEGGYPDAGLARWRTLYEIAVVCMFIRKYGKPAAEDYIKHGMVKSVEGMNEHRKTAEVMNASTFSGEELDEANELKQHITGGEKSWHWARKYAGVSKFEKLREHVGMGKWSANYKWASKNIHTDYYEMGSMLATSEGTEDILVVDKSNSGMTDPAHFTAISLYQITTIFITTYSDGEASPLNYQDSYLFERLMDHYVDEVGESFLKIQNEM